MRERLNRIIYSQGVYNLCSLQVQDNRIVIFEDTSDGSRICIDCDFSMKEFKISTKVDKKSDWEGIDISTSLRLEVVDLDNYGRRIEGHTVNGEILGFVKEYNMDGILVFDGFVFRGKKYGYGISYFQTDGEIESKAYYYRDMKCGPAQIYDKKGDSKTITCLNDKTDYVKHLKVTQDIEWHQLHTLVEAIAIFHTGSLKMLYLIGYSRLREFYSNTNCGLSSLRVLKINNCHNLCSIVITKADSIVNYMINSKLVEISVCDKLTTLSIGPSCLKYTNRFELFDLPSLEVVSIGINALQGIEFNFNKFPVLKEISIDKTFQDTPSFKATDLPKLEKLDLNSGRGKTVTLKNLPSLTDCRLHEVDCITSANISSHIWAGDLVNKDCIPDPQKENYTMYIMPTKDQMQQVTILILLQGQKIPLTLPTMPCLEYLIIRLVISSLTITHQPRLRYIFCMENIKSLTITDCPMLSRIELDQAQGTHLTLDKLANLSTLIINHCNIFTFPLVIRETPLLKGIHLDPHLIDIHYSRFKKFIMSQSSELNIIMKLSWLTKYRYVTSKRLNTIADYYKYLKQKCSLC